MRRWPDGRQDVVLLLESEARVHDPVRHVAVVREEEKPLGVSVQPSDRVDPLGEVHQLHHGPAASLVAHRRDVAAGLVDHQVAERLGPEESAVDPDLGKDWIDLCPELRHDHTVHHDPTLADQVFGGAARGDAAGGKHALEAFHGDL